MAIINGFMNKLGFDAGLGEGYIEADPPALILTSNQTHGTITITKIGDGDILLENSNPNICSTSLNGNIITCNLQDFGAVTLTITTNSSSHLPASVEVPIACTPPTLALCYPSEIQAIAQTGLADTLWDIGDITSNITVQNFGYAEATTMKAFIIGFNHNSEVEGRGITFQMGKHIASASKGIAFVDNLYGISATHASNYSYFRMSTDSYNTGGWASCTMRLDIIPAFMAALPSDWRDVIRSDVTKWTLNSSGYGTSASLSTYVTSTTESAFLLATWEVFGARNSTNIYESSHQAQYAYYANGNTKIMYKSSSSTTACAWWLRSPYMSSNNVQGGGRRYTAVATNGTWGYASANYSYGFSPAFVVG